MKKFFRNLNIKILLLGAMWMTPQALLASASLTVSSDATNFFYQLTYSGTPTFLHVFLDTDQNAATGYSFGGVGAEYMIENDVLYKFTGSSGSNWSWQSLGTSSQIKTPPTVKWTLSHTSIGNPSALKVIANTSNGDVSAIVTQTSSPPPNNTISFTPSDAVIINPERGFFLTTDCRSNPVSVSQLQGYRSQYGHSVFNCLWYLKEFKNAPLTNAVLEQLQTQMNNMRSAGFKMILRLAYTNTDINDAPLSIVRGHLDQLAPLFRNNSDIIATVQTGIIGQWGEMSTSANYGGANGPFTATDWANRKAVIDKLLSVIPASRMVGVRTPEFKIQPYGASPLTDAEAFSGTARARVSHYNDCFLSSPTDWGTYRNQSDKDFVKQDSKFLATSGETCFVATENDCINAVPAMASLHWSLLHEGYNTDVINKWKSQGCFDTIRSRLGYRLQLQNATLPTTAAVGGTISVNINIVNVGFAALFNERPVKLVLRNTSTGAVFLLPLNADPRRWLPGSTITVNQSLTLPSTLPAGSYAMLLALPDAASNLAPLPSYSIQFANVGLWEASTGFNSLKTTLVVTATQAKTAVSTK